jgi:hypothetical protein
MGFINRTKRKLSIFDKLCNAVSAATKKHPALGHVIEVSMKNRSAMLKGGQASYNERNNLGISAPPFGSTVQRSMMSTFCIQLLSSPAISALKRKRKLSSLISWMIHTFMACTLGKCRGHKAAKSRHFISIVNCRR